MGDIVKVNWSGGKDSTCAVMKHIENGDTVKVVCYIPMFTKEIPLISKAHYNFIIKTSDKFKKLGAQVHIITGLTYYEYVTHIATKGKYKGKIFGFPYFKRSMCGFKRDSKIKALRSYDVGAYDYEEIGICSDEKTRHNQLNNVKRSILVENNISQIQTKAFCETNDLLSPNYKNKKQKRDGCALCPHAKEEERIAWFKDYPEAIKIVIELQELVKRERPERTPLRGYKYFI